jgi:hypothetical protein
LASICEELTSAIVLFEWFIAFKSDSDFMAPLYKQLGYMLDSIRFLLIADLPLGTCQELLLKLLAKFYAFMITLCKNVRNIFLISSNLSVIENFFKLFKIASRNIKENEQKLLKNTVDITVKQFQKPINHLIRLVQNAKSSLLKEKEAEKKGSGKQRTVGKESNNQSITKVYIYSSFSIIFT